MRNSRPTGATVPRILITVVCLVAAVGLSAQRRNDTATALDSLVREADEFRLEHSPETATLNGDHRFNSRWSEFSVAQRRREVAHAESLLARLKALDRAALSEEDNVSLDVLLFNTQLAVDTGGFPSEYLFLDQMRSPHLTIARVLSAMPARTAADYEVILARLEALAHVFDQLCLPKTRYALHQLRLLAFSDSLPLWLQSSRCFTHFGSWSGHAPRCIWKSSRSDTSWPS